MQVPRLDAACIGGSGHAFKMGPAIGDAAAALALGLKPPFSLETFRLDRPALLRA